MARQNPNLRFGVFQWNDCGVYKPAEALFSYKREHAAKKTANDMTAIRQAIKPAHRGFVVRSFYVEEGTETARAGRLAY